MRNKNIQLEIPENLDHCDLEVEYYEGLARYLNMYGSCKLIWNVRDIQYHRDRLASLEYQAFKEIIALIKRYCTENKNLDMSFHFLENKVRGHFLGEGDRMNKKDYKLVEIIFNHYLLNYSQNWKQVKLNNLLLWCRTTWYKMKWALT